MGKWHSYGYVPQDGQGAGRAQREAEDELLREHLPTILGHSRRIVETRRYFYCQLTSAWLSTWFFYNGGGPIPLGVLILLWDSGEMVFDCVECGGNLYAIGVGGSPLSGSATVWGVCEGCRKSQRRTHSKGSLSIHAVGQLLQRHTNERIVERGQEPRFDWKEGLIGESTPDRVILPPVEAVDFLDLVRELNGVDGQETDVSR
jgi:hypothetical protein